jgi:hypothetical protein
VKKGEFDPSYPLILLLKKCKVIKLTKETPAVPETSNQPSANSSSSQLTVGS